MNTRRIIRLTLSGLVVLLCAFGCATHEGALKAVTQRFAELREAGRVPALRSDEEGEFSVYRVTNDMRVAEWFAPFRQEVGTCRNLYAVDMKPPGRHLMIFLCGGGAGAEAVATYERKQGAWQLLQRAAITN